MRLKLPSSVEVELQYPYLENPVVYVFPLRQKRDAELEERERLFGAGRKMKPAERLAGLVEDVRGFESMGFEPRAATEDLDAFRRRVVEFFSSEDGQELAEHAVLYRGAAVSPQSIFRRGEDSGVAVDIRGKEAGGPITTLPDLHTARTRPSGGVSDVSANEGNKDPEGAGPG